MKRNKPLRLLLILCFYFVQPVLRAQDSTQRHVPLSVVDSFHSAKAYEYANDPEYWRKPVQSKNDSWKFLDYLFTENHLKFIGYCFLLLVFCFVIYRLYRNGVFYRNESRQQVLIDNTTDVTTLDEQSLTTLLDELIADAKYREAIRAQYLLTLISLDKSGLIKLDPNSTNRDYSAQLKTHKAHRSFAWLLRIYEYAWYGDAKITEQDYAFAEKRFNDFKRSF